jgi:hypothetical protein
LYNNLCTSTILTSYIPVYVFVYAIQLLVSMLLMVVLTSVEYSSIPAWLQKGLHGVFWPGHEWISDRIVPRDLLKATEIISFDILSHLAVFVTFGISSPYLAAILIFSVCLKLYLWRLVIGRFAHSRSSANNGEGVSTIAALSGSKEPVDDGLSSLSLACLPIMDMLEDCMRPIVFSSALFFACVCWDVAGDEVDWRDSSWAPLSVLTFPLVLWVILFAHGRYTRGGLTNGAEGSEDGTTDDSQDHYTRTSVNNPIRVSCEASISVATSDIELRVSSMIETTGSICTDESE